MLGRYGIFFASFGIFLTSAIASTAQEAPPTSQNYATKIVCGTQPDPKNLQFVQGYYATVVNILNTGPKSRKYALHLALAHPPVPPAQGEVFDMGTVTLGSGRAAAVDCTDIQVLAFPFGLPDTYIDGFLVVEAKGPVSVQAVYTAAPLLKESCCKTWPGPVASIDVERIDAVPTLAGTTKPDLLPDSPTLETDPLGAPGTGFCSQQPSDGSPPDAVAVIINQGEAGAGPSAARFDFGDFGQSQSPVPALGPNEKHEVTAEIPRRCFGSGRSNTCAFDVIADADQTIDESLETNNARKGHCLRSSSGAEQ